MKLEQIILKRALKGKVVTVAEIVKITGFSRAYVHRFFKSLIEKGKMVRMGRANRAQYVIADNKIVRETKKKFLTISRTFENKDLEEDKAFDLIGRETGILIDIPENVKRILEYAFTEMLNNAIEHSRSLKIKMVMDRQDIVRFDIIDWGIGIFENLIHSRHLANTEEAIQDLLKGKQTTDPERHTGEGIFFTRRVADTFIIRSSAKKLFFNNLQNDFTITTIKPIIGTHITFTIADNSKKELRDVFKQFSTEAFEFGATEVNVKLYKPGGAREFISRSQARRILSGLEKFKQVTLDFNGVVAVGQGFADEVFRIWHKRHPSIDIIAKNANEDVQFMVKRANNPESP